MRMLIALTLLLLAAGCDASKVREQSPRQTSGADLSTGNPSKNGLIAFSLAEAERNLRAGIGNDREIETLAGMTRLMGFVHDGDAHDLILLGRAEASEPSIDLPSLVVAMRAVLVLQEWPLVSIDPAADSEQPQKVRLEGGIANTQFGKDFFLADVRLKRLGLGLDMAPTLDGISYLHLRAAAASKESSQFAGSSRFWFYPLNPGLEQRDDVFLTRHLELGVRAQTVQVGGKKAQTPRDHAAEIFSRKLTGSFSKLCERFPDIGRLQSLYEMVAVARGMQELPEPVSNYWLKEYQVSVVDTPKDFPLVRQQEEIVTASGKRILEVSGGIDFKALTIRLLDDDVTALKEAVLLARGRGRRLAWNVPISGDVVLGAAIDGTSGSGEETDAGSHLSWKVREPSNADVQRKAAIDRGIAEIDQYLKSTAPKFLDPIKEAPQPDPPESSGGSGFLCITASCVGPRQSTPDGLEATPYARGDLRYSLNRYFDAGYSVTSNGKVIGSGYGDVHLLGGGLYAAKEWNGPGYQIYDGSGKALSTRTFRAVENIGQNGFFAVHNEDGIGMSTVYSRDLKPVHTVPTYDLKSYLGSEEFQKDVIQQHGDRGGIMANVTISEQDFEEGKRTKK